MTKSNIELSDKIKSWLDVIYTILKNAVASFEREGAARGAAGMAYYTLLSFFPVLIVMVSISTYFVNESDTSSRVFQIITSVIPVSQNLVVLNISRIMSVRNSIGIFGLIVLLWSGSNAFTMMVHYINGAWPPSERRSFFEKKLFGLALVILLIVILFILMLSSTALNMLMKYSQSVPGLEVIFSGWAWNLGAKILYWLVPFIFFYSIYRIVPMGRVPIRAAGLSALGITVIWRLASNIFQIYLGSKFARYEVVFGSLSAIVVLMLWIYISSLIMFFGAHICASVSRKTENDK